MKRNIKSLLFSTAILSLTAVLSVSCHRLPIHEPFSSYYLVLDPDFSAIHIKPSNPGMYEAVFYDKETHKEIGQSYLGSYGGYIYDLTPGTYEMIVYGFDSGNTVVSGMKGFNDALANTERYKDADTLSYNAPDHLMVARDTNFIIPFMYDRDEPVYLYEYPSTIMDTWCIIITGIKGLNNAVSMDFYITGQSKSNNFGPNIPSEKEMTIHFPASVDNQNNRIYTPFCTFGKLPDHVSKLRLVIKDPNQQTITVYADITDQFDDPENVGHWIILDFDLEIDAKKDGGMMPDVNEWNDNVFEYNIH
ncbi:MAG: DUF5119 domain-containing protein [Bacteroidales bacterium]|nr:DUF5119 domain-containing protein [Candidatus Cacconaster merdequi]